MIGGKANTRSDEAHDHPVDGAAEVPGDRPGDAPIVSARTTSSTASGIVTRAPRITRLEHVAAEAVGAEPVIAAGTEEAREVLGVGVGGRDHVAEHEHEQPGAGDDQPDHRERPSQRGDAAGAAVVGGPTATASSTRRRHGGHVCLTRGSMTP